MQTGPTMPYAGNDPKTGLPNGVDRGWDYLGGEFPVAALDAELHQMMDAQQPVVMLSRVTVDEHRHHPEIGAAEYTLAQRMIDEAALYKQATGRIIALWRNGDTLYQAALKRTGDKGKNYWLTLFTTTEDVAKIQVGDKFKLIRQAAGGARIATPIASSVPL